MSNWTYESTTQPKPLIWLHGEIKTPPFSKDARIEAGTLLRQLQAGASIGLPHSRPMPDIGPKTHELRITDETKLWRIYDHIAPEGIVILAVIDKDTRKTPKSVIDTCKTRLKKFLQAVQ